MAKQRAVRRIAQKGWADAAYETALAKQAAAAAATQTAAAAVAAERTRERITVAAAARARDAVRCETAALRMPYALRRPRRAAGPP